MYTKKQVVLTSTRIASIIGISIGFGRESWLEAVCYFIVTIIFIMVLPWALTKLRLKRDEFEEVDGELFLWGDEDGKIEYHLTINDAKTIPFKEFIKIRINENARDESIMKK